MKPTLKQVLAIVTPNSVVRCDTITTSWMGIPEDGIADQSSSKIQVSQTRRF
jgi:hypothetical protein